LLATRHVPSAGALYRLTDEVLRSSARGARSLTIISAFYDLQWCREFIAAAKVNHVRLVVNGLGGRRLVQQKSELRELKGDVSELGIQLDVRLAFAPGIFHSKLILMKHAKHTVGFIGSANATTAAMQRNEEIMLRIGEDLTDLVDYADRICSEYSVDADADAEEKAPDNLVAFFRTGSLYFKSITSLQLTLNPFREIERAMSSDMKARLGSVSLPYAEGQTGIGPFSLVRALELPADERSVAAKIKPFVVETSLGYWVPDALADDLGSALEEATHTKRRIWRRRRKTINSTSLAEAKELYKEYIDAIRGVLVENGIRLAKLLDKTGPDPLSVDRFDGFYRSVTARLGNEEFFRRLIEPFHRAGLPELWDDPLARKEFEESFFAYLEFTSTLGRRPRVPGIILRELSGSPNSDEEIKKALIKRLRKGWEKELWEKK
jgi:hypothetical protein